MSIRHPVPPIELGTKYTHKGWFMFCPVYIGGTIYLDPELHERNWVPSWWFDIAVWFCQSINWVLSAVDPDYVPLFPIKVGKRLRTSKVKK